MGKWTRSSMKCRLCGHEHESVYPTDIKEVQNQECPKCGHMTSAPIDLQDEGEDSYEQEDWQDDTEDEG